MTKAKLSPNEIATIVHVLDAWEGTLTWESLAAELPRILGRPFTSQTLRRYTSIAGAFASAKLRRRVVRVLVGQGSDPATSKRLVAALAKAPEAAEAGPGGRSTSPAKYSARR